MHGAIAAVLFPSGAHLGRKSFIVAAVAPLSALIWLCIQLPDIVEGRVITQHLSWVPQLGLSVDLRLDGFGALMMLLITLIGVVVCGYSAAYFSPTSPGLGRCAGLLVAFAAAMLVVVLSDNLFLLATAWELTSITSYLLIGNDHTKVKARAAALQALLITALGGLAMLAGFVLIGQAAGTYRLSAILASPPTGGTVSVGLALVLIGAFTKSAQYPFHSWLPGAMAAPTPISAYLHSATMVKAGVYLVGRFAPAFATVTIWRPLVLGVGATTMVLGGLRAMRQHDLKLLLAFGTVSQLGFLIVLFGAGTPEATAAGCVMLLAHALFKATLFMVVGALDRRTGTRDLRRIPVLGREWLGVKIAAVAAAASMAGVPLLLGFIGKEAGLDALGHAGFGASGWVIAAIVAGSALTVAYSVRFVWGMFGGGSLVSERNDPDRAPRLEFLVPVAVLAGIGIVLGVAPALANGLVEAASTALDPAAPAAHLAIWHGANLALALSAVALAGGTMLFLVRDRIEPVLAVGGRVPSGAAVYTRLLRGTNNAATVTTSVIQNGSLPLYAGVTLATAAVVPGAFLVSRAAWPGFPRFVEHWAQLPVVIAILGAAVAAAVVRRRFSAALFLGTTGYAMAGLFVVQGAPDLALTQVAIETLSTVLFVLVLRRLPDRFERTSSNRRRALRLVVSGLVGVLVFTFAIVSRANRDAVPVSTEMIARSLPEAHGRNVVNVILVDIRGFDTMGEITVLTAAGIGAVALARAGKRRRSSREVAS